jgi:mRNA interferase MazF
MPIKFHPEPGTLLFCEFSPSFKEPEMVKRRPVVVVSKNMKGRTGLVTVLPISTQKPDPLQKYHYLLPKASLPMLGYFQQSDSWVKADMVYTVGFQRLDAILLSRKDKRVYFNRRLGREQMGAIYSCMLEGIGLSHLCEHL